MANVRRIFVQKDAIHIFEISWGDVRFCSETIGMTLGGARLAFANGSTARIPETPALDPRQKRLATKAANADLPQLMRSTGLSMDAALQLAKIHGRTGAFMAVRDRKDTGRNCVYTLG